MSILDLQPHDLKDRRFRLESLPTNDGRLEIYEEPVPGLTYVIGGDFALGMEGRDYDAFVGLVKGDGKPRQVFEAHGHWGERADRLLYALAIYYNKAFIVGERQVGLPILRRLYTDFGYANLYYERSERDPTRRHMDSLGHPRIYDDFTLRNLRIAVQDQTVELRSLSLMEQMQKLEFYAKGEDGGVKDRARDEALRVRIPGGGSPDLVMGAAYAWLGIREVAHFAPPPSPYAPDSLGAILEHEFPGGNRQTGASLRNPRLNGR